MKTPIGKFVVTLTLAAAVVGCETKAQTGAAAGAGGGALLGGVIGHQSGHAAGGAVIGGLLGAGGGYLAGNQMDKNDRKKEKERDRALESRPSSSAVAAVTKQDVINWSARNTSDDVIISRLRQSGSTFYLTAADEKELRDNGVSPRVIDAMRAR